MADAKALFIEHMKHFSKLNRESAYSDQVNAVLYAACIVAEAITNQFDEVQDAKFEAEMKNADLNIP